MKKCPYCAEEIQDAATVCRHCGRDLTTGAQPAQEPKKKSGFVRIILFIGLGLIGLCLFLVFVGLLLPDNETSPKSNEAQSETVERQPQSASSFSTPIPTSTLAPTAIPSPTAVPTEIPSPTPIPTITPSSLTMAEIEENRENLTEAQWEDYEKTLPGIRVHWAGSVNQVYKDGTITLDVGQDIFRSVFLDGIPQDVWKNLSKNQAIEVEATIRKVDTFLGLTVYLEDPVIVGIR